MRVEAGRELFDPQLRQPCRKVLDSLQGHWPGLVRFIDDPRTAMDNAASERAVRGPPLARKSFYGSGSSWSGRLATATFSLLATRARRNLHPRRWLTWYLESRATAGGRVPEDIQPRLPWNLSDERRAASAVQTTSPAASSLHLPSPPPVGANPLLGNSRADGLDEASLLTMAVNGSSEVERRRVKLPTSALRKHPSQPDFSTLKPLLPASLRQSPTVCKPLHRKAVFCGLLPYFGAYARTV